MLAIDINGQRYPVPDEIEAKVPDDPAALEAWAIAHVPGYAAQVAQNRAAQAATDAPTGADEAQS